MKKSWVNSFFSLSSLSVAVSLFLVFILPKEIHASGYVLLEPLPTLGGNTSPDFVEYISAVYKLTIGFAGVLAVFMIIIGGVEYIFSAIPSAKNDARSRITGAIFGLLLVLTAWILLNTINPALLQKGFGLMAVGGGGTFNQTVGNGPSDQGNAYCTAVVATQVSVCYPTQLDCENDLVNPPAKVQICGQYNGDVVFVTEEINTRTVLKSHNIHISQDSCGSANVNGAQYNCTNVFGFESNGMVDLLVAFKSACDAGSGFLSDRCDLNIINGTESGISGHGQGSKVVDLSEIDNGFLDSDDPQNWEINTFLGVPNPSDGDTASKNGLFCTFMVEGHGGSSGAVWHCQG